MSYFQLFLDNLKKKKKKKKKKETALVLLYILLKLFKKIQELVMKDL